jgi:hypothetical protein
MLDGKVFPIVIGEIAHCILNHRYQISLYQLERMPDTLTLFVLTNINYLSTFLVSMMT